MARVRVAFASILIAFTILLGTANNAAHAASLPPPLMTTTVAQKSLMRGMPVAEVPKPSNGARVTDTANLLGIGARARLNEQLRAVEKRTESEIHLVTLATIGSRDQKAFATDLFNRWRVGASTRDRGVLVLFVADGGKNGRGRIEVVVWKGFNSRVSKSWTTEMLQDSVLPKLRKGEFETGFARCVARVEPRLTMSALDDSNEAWTTAVLVYLGVGGVWSVVSERNSRRCEKCGSVCGGLAREAWPVGPWEVVKEATDVSAGQKEREIICHKCGASSLKVKAIPKYDGKRQRRDGTWHYYYNSDGGGGGSDGGGGGGGD